MATNEAPAYTIVEYNGQKARKYANGAIRDTNGRILKPQPGFVEEHSVKDSESARALTRKRWEKYQNAAAEAVRAEVGSIAPGGSTPFAAWGVLVADQATKLLDYQKPRVRELQHLGQIIGAVPTVYDGGEQEQTGVTMSEGVASQLLDLLNGMVRQNVDVIDG